MFTPDPIDVFVGVRLRELRKAAHMSQDTLGKAVGVTFQQVQKYERGTNRISFSTLVRLATALGVAPAQFFDGLPDLDVVDEAGAEGLGAWIAGPEGQAWSRMGFDLTPALRRGLEQVAVAAQALSAAPAVVAFPTRKAS